MIFLELSELRKKLGVSCAVLAKPASLATPLLSLGRMGQTDIHAELSNHLREEIFLINGLDKN